jgi:hypothetical protein
VPTPAVGVYTVDPNAMFPKGIALPDGVQMVVSVQAKPKFVVPSRTRVTELPGAIDDGDTDAAGVITAAVMFQVKVPLPEP